ncbi:MAG: glycosyltransferase [Bacteroidota bacterium]|nr:glycosyltransferase [Bacteroidota bacterium]
MSIKVAHFCSSFSVLSETFIYDYVIELERQGIDNHIVTFDRQNEKERPFPKVHLCEQKRDLKWLFKRIVCEFNNSPSKLWGIYQSSIKDVLKKLKPDIIHVQFGDNGAMIAPIAEKLNIPIVITFHGYDISQLLEDEFWVNKYKRLFKKDVYAIGVSNFICNKIKKLGCPEERVVRLPAGININDFELIDLKQKKEVVCIHVGRLVEKKSPILLVKAIKHAIELLKNEYTIKLVIIGDGPLRQELEETIKELELQENVVLKGPLPHNKIIEELSQANIYTQHCVTANNGDQEGMGVSFAEASAKGLPIVSTRHNGIPDVVIDNKTGFLVEEKDFRTMGEKIAFLCENQQIGKQFGLNGREHIKTNLNIEIQVSKAIELYKNIIKKHEN